MRRAAREGGLTLIEVLVALVLLTLLLTSLCQGMLMLAANNTAAERSSGAVTASQTVLETLKARSSLPALGSEDFTQTVGARTYLVRVTYCPTDATVPCTGAQRFVRVNVSEGDRALYQVETVYAP